MNISAVIPWFGCGRLVAESFGNALDGCSWVGIPFAGGMPELAFIKARTIIANDLHFNVMNLASVISSDEKLRELIKWCDRQPFHAGVLARSQAWLIAHEQFGVPTSPELGDLEAAKHYFVSQWMGRSAKGGKEDELMGKLPVRWNANGGDSNTRYRSAIRSLVCWGKIMRRCNFTHMCAFEFLKNCKDENGHGLLIDPPWPDDGKAYKHAFRDDQHERLRDALLRFNQTRVVIRYGRHPLIESLYPPDNWHWQELDGRTSGNNTKAEVLLVNRASIGEQQEGDLF